MSVGVGPSQIWINMAVSVDGKIATANREYPRLGSTLDRQRMHELRAAADAVLVGAQTVREIDPPIHVPPASREPSGLRPIAPIAVVLTASGLIEPDSRVFAGPPDQAVVIATVDKAELPLAALPHHVRVWKLGEERVDIARLLERLGKEGVDTLLVEGGAETNWQFISSGVVTDLFVTITPTLIGGTTAPSLMAGPGFSMATRPRLRLVDVKQEQDELFCHYRLTS